MMLCHMVFILKKASGMTTQQPVPFHMINMILITENVCYDGAKNVQVLSYPVKNKTRTKQAHVPQ